MPEFDVFLCHNSQDKPKVVKIAQQLQQQGLKPWLDIWELPPGQSWQELLEEQIEDVRSAAVFVGSSGLGPWQKREMRAFLNEFVNRGCPVIPVLLENAPQKPKLPIFLQALTWVDFRDSDSNPIERLIWGITQNKAKKGKDLSFETVDGQVPLNSPFYIERPQIETNCYEAVLEPGALIRIKAPRKMGKTSLMSRILAHGVKQGHKSAMINLWSNESLTDIKTFLQWFCASISVDLKLEVKLEKYWKKYLPSQQNCSKYFSDYILKEVPVPIVLGLDDVDQIFAYPAIAEEFFKLLRSWHEKGKNNELWQKLRIIISHSQEVYIDLNVNHSPFGNVGSSFELGEFNQLQIKELIKRHRLNWSTQEIDQLINMVDGHPYLLRMALYHLAKDQLTLDKFLELAPTEQGLFVDHLYGYLLVLENNPSLRQAMRKVITSDSPVKVESQIAFKLRSLGLVKSIGNKVSILCDVYRLYFLDRLND